MLDEIFKAYSDWIGAYFRKDMNAGSYFERYANLRDKLPKKEQAHWPI